MSLDQFCVRHKLRHLNFKTKASSYVQQWVPVTSEVLAIGNNADEWFDTEGFADAQPRGRITSSIGSWGSTSAVVRASIY